MQEVQISSQSAKHGCAAEKSIMQKMQKQGTSACAQEINSHTKKRWLTSSS
jgi:hypothetical protein